MFLLRHPRRPLLLLLICCLLVLPLMLHFAQARAADSMETASETEIHMDLEPSLTYADSEDTSPFALAEGYIHSRLYPTKKRAILPAAGNSLTGTDRILYDLLRSHVLSVAAGETTDTILTIDPVLIYGQTEFTAQELGVTEIVVDGAVTAQAKAAASALIRISSRPALLALLHDEPYAFYWYDKTSGLSMSYPSYAATASKIMLRGQFTLKLTVAEYYAEEPYVMAEGFGSLVTGAVNRARQIVSSYALYTDTGKLQAYKDEICALTAYNYAALASGTPYGNPWQLIWVFDGDETTNVVCEGYAKAFQYLCDLSTFEHDVSSITVTGTMGGANHMWNLVSMDDDVQYIVDVTNCDTGTYGYPDALFLAGTDAGSVLEGYTFSSRNITELYVYDETTLTLFSEEALTLGTSGYFSRFSLPAPSLQVSPQDCLVGTPVSLSILAGDVTYDAYVLRISDAESTVSVQLPGDTTEYAFSEGFETSGNRVFALQGLLGDAVSPWSDCALLCVKTFDLGAPVLTSLQFSSDLSALILAWSDLAPDAFATYLEGYTLSLVGPDGTVLSSAFDTDCRAVLNVPDQASICSLQLQPQPAGAYLASPTSYDLTLTWSDRTCSLASLVFPDSETRDVPELLSIFPSLSQDLIVSVPVCDLTLSASGPVILTQWKDADHPRVPQGVTALGEGLFRDWVTLQTLDLPDSLTDISAHAFDGCTALTALILPESVTACGDFAFRGCTALTAFSAPGLQLLGDGVFQDVSALEVLDLPALTHLGSAAGAVFQNMAALRSLTFPETVTEVWTDDLMTGCAALETVRFLCADAAVHTTGQPVLDTPNVQLFAPPLSAIARVLRLPFVDGQDPDWTYAWDAAGQQLTALSYAGNAADLSILPGVHILSAGLLQGHTDLVSLSLPDSLTAIGAGCFADTALTDAALPSGLVTLGEEAFPALCVLRLPENMAEVGHQSAVLLLSPVCATAAHLSSPQPFSDPETGSGYLFLDDVLYLTRGLSDPDALGHVGGLYAMDEPVVCGLEAVHLSLPQALTRFLRSSGTSSAPFFSDCPSLSSLTLPEGLTTIPTAFVRACPNLTTLILPETLTEIEDDAFESTLQTVYGYAGTAAESWAESKGLTFIDLNCPEAADSALLLADDLFLHVGDTLNLSDILLSVPALSLPLSVVSSDETVLRYENGVIRAMAAGEAALYVGYEGHPLHAISIPATVWAYVTGFTLPSEVFVPIGEPLTLTLMDVEPAAFHDPSFTWHAGDAQATGESFRLNAMTEPGVLLCTVSCPGGYTRTCRIILYDTIRSLSLQTPVDFVTGEAAEVLVVADVDGTAYVNPEGLCTLALDEGDAFVLSDLRLLVAVSEGEQTLTVYGPQDTSDSLLLSARAPRTLTLPASLTDIEEEALSGLSMEALIIPGDCGHIGSLAFADCADLRVIVLSGDTDIASDAFALCTALTTVRGPRGLSVQALAQSLGCLFVPVN